MSTVDYNDPDFFSRNIPVWTEVLKLFKDKRNLQFVEVGSMYGRSACWLLQNVLTDPSSRLTCIDLFTQSLESLSYCSLLNFDGPQTFEKNFDDRIAAIGATDRVIKLVEDSEVALRTLPLYTYDCVYIDGSHTSRGVLTDLVLSWGILKRNGLLIIDDYMLNVFIDNPLKNPVIGINAFLSVFKDEYTVVHSGEQVILKKTAAKDEIWRSESVSTG